jgi:hypothetical protein
MERILHPFSKQLINKEHPYTFFQQDPAIVHTARASIYTLRELYVSLIMESDGKLP